MACVHDEVVHDDGVRDAVLEVRGSTANTDSIRRMLDRSGEGPAKRARLGSARQASARQKRNR